MQGSLTLWFKCGCNGNYIYILWCISMRHSDLQICEPSKDGDQRSSRSDLRSLTIWWKFLKKIKNMSLYYPPGISFLHVCASETSYFAIWTNKFSTWAASSSQTETCLAPIKLMCFIMFPIVILKILLEKRKSPMKFKISLGPLNSHWTPSICFLQYWRGPEKMVDPIYLWACSNSWYPHTLMYIQGLEHNTHRRITHVTSDLKIEISICIDYLSNECFHVFCFHRAVMIS